MEGIVLGKEEMEIHYGSIRQRFFDDEGMIYYLLSKKFVVYAQDQDISSNI